METPQRWTSSACRWRHVNSVSVTWTQVRPCSTATAQTPTTARWLKSSEGCCRKVLRRKETCQLRVVSFQQHRLGILRKKAVAHNPKVGGSNPPPATNFNNNLQAPVLRRFSLLSVNCPFSPKSQLNSGIPIHHLWVHWRQRENNGPIEQMQDRQMDVDYSLRDCAGIQRNSSTFGVNPFRSTIGMPSAASAFAPGSMS